MRFLSGKLTLDHILTWHRFFKNINSAYFIIMLVSYNKIVYNSKIKKKKTEKLIGRIVAQHYGFL